MKFSIKDLFSQCDQICSTPDLVTFTAEILYLKLHFLCSDNIFCAVKRRKNSGFLRLSR